MLTLDRSLAAKRILVIEDVLLVAMEVEDHLAHEAGAAVTIAPTLECAIKEARRGGWDAAVVDLNLHGKLSLPVIEVLARAGVPIVVTSGYCGAVHGLDQSIPRLEKPYDLHTLDLMLADAICRRDDEQSDLK